MTIAVATMITVGLTVNFLMAPNIHVIVPDYMPPNLSFQIPKGEFGGV